MNTTKIPLYLTLLIFFTIVACNTTNNETNTDFLELSGVYIGQEKPEFDPVMFAPEIVSTELYERDAAFSRFGKVMFYTVKNDGGHVLMYTFFNEEEDRWLVPDVAPFSGTYDDIEPCFANRGKGLYFVSNRPVDGKEKGAMDWDIWFTIKTLAGWNEPQNIGAPINTEQMESFPSVTFKGTLYFTRNSEDNSRTDIFRSKFVDGKFEEPERLPEIINAEARQFNAAIAPDESYLVFCSMKEGGYGGTDYWISFLNRDSTWSEPVNLGERFNTSENEISPHFSPGGRYFFFASEGNPIGIPDSLQKTISEKANSDIYWVKAEMLEELER